MKLAKRKQVFDEINITPLTDIFLVLLIIMMVVAPMLQTTGLKVAVPSVGPSDDVKEEPKVITLNIDAQGNYTIEGGGGVNRLFLSAELRKQKLENPDGVVIQTSSDASHEALTFAMDAAQMAGITKVAVTEETGTSDAEAAGLPLGMTE